MMDSREDSGPTFSGRWCRVVTVKGRGTEVASGLLGTGLFLGQTLKTQGRTTCPEGQMVEHDPSHRTIQNTQPEHYAVTWASSCCCRLPQMAPELRAAKPGIPKSEGNALSCGARVGPPIF